MEGDGWRHERAAWEAGFSPVCGIDEAGRGPLAGPVFAAAVILSPDAPIAGIDDSKKLSARRRDALYDEIHARAAAFCIASASVAEIEQYNILGASMLAMRRAAAGLSVTPALCLVDGPYARDFTLPARCLVGGDHESVSVAAAAILAKVERDRYMLAMAEAYPQYAFERHKGYPTKLHYERLLEYGPSEIHRPSFLKKLGGQKGGGSA